MKTEFVLVRLVALILASTLGACQAEEYQQGVRVTPGRVTLGASEQQAFAAVPPTVVWSVRQGDAGGSITDAGLYTAPAVPGTFTVVAQEPTSGLFGEASVQVVSTGTTITHGMAILGAHPRLWYDEARLARGRAWYPANPFSPDMSSPNVNDHIEMATRGLLNNESAQCRAAISYALAASAQMPLSGTSCDMCRWEGEAIILAYDWCYAFMTPAERTSFISSTNAWVNHWRQQSWGGPQMPENNYFWGYLRNQLMWAITSYHENVAMAETLLDDVFTTRLQNAFYPAAAPTGPMRGGIGREGTQYGIYIESYALVPWTTAWLTGRDLYTETDYWREAAYHLIYSVSPSPTTGAGPSQVVNMGFTFFPYSDDEQWLNGGQIDEGAGNFMSGIAMRWPGTAVGRHARQWLATTAARTSPYVRSVDPGGTAAPFTDLPLDYYGPGAGMLYGRNAWGAAATAFHLQLRDGPDNGHSHAQWGNWQIWRNGRYLSRETVSYGENIAGYGGAGTVAASLQLAHNSLLINGAGNRSSPWISGLADVRRLESQPAYAFAATDLTDTSNNPSFVRWVREYVFVRGLETLVILDRVQSSSATATKTFLSHCETNPTTGAATATCTNGGQALVMTTLVPASPSLRVVAEGGGIGQHRIEVDTSPGTAQSYILTVLQAKDAAGASLAPSVVEDASTFTVTLNGSNGIVFQKGMTSTGGSITTGGSTTAFRADVQGIAVGDAGPAWQ